MISESQSERRFPFYLSLGFGLYALLGGGITLVGWFANIPSLTDWDGDGIAMFANTAALACAGGLALLLHTCGGKRASAWVSVLGLSIAFMGAATLFEHLAGMDLGIDRLLVRDPWSTRAAMAPGRPGPPSAVTFTLLGVGLVLLTGGRRARRIVPALGTITCAIASLSLMGYIFGADPLYAVARFTAISMQSTTIILALAAGLIASVPERQPMRALCENSAAGALARRAFPFIVGLPVFLGWLWRCGQRSGLFDLSMGAALLVLILITLLCVLLWWCVAIVAERETTLRLREDSLMREITERRRTEQTLARRVQEQTALYEFTDRLHHAASLNEIHQAAIECIVTALHCQRAAVLLADATGCMRFVSWRGLSEPYRQAVEGHSPWRADDPNAQPICIEDVETADLPADLRPVVQAEGIRSLAFIPLYVSGRLIGKFMSYYDAPHVFAPEEVAFAMAIARQLASGVEQKEAEDALRSNEAMLRSITDHSADLIFIKDRDSRVLFINPTGLRMGGLARERIIGRTDLEIFPDDPEQAAAFMAADQRVMTSLLPETIEEKVRSPEGASFVLLTTKTPRLDAEGKVIGIVGISRDITERKRAEGELRLAAERAQEASRAKDDFLAALSHELRTPLNPALMTAAALESDPTLSHDVREQLAMIRRNIQLEARLIDDLLDLTRVSHGKLLIHPVVTNVHQLIKHAQETISQDVHDKRIVIRLRFDATEAHVHADPARLQQVLWNLLKNAVKFTPAGGCITVSTSNPTSGRVAVHVEDTGIGIATTELQSIFLAFNQGDLVGRHQFGGLGLGLSISKAIVDAHGGELLAQSAGPGKGAAFIMEIDTAPAPAVVMPGQQRIPPSRSAPLRLLIVEDHHATLSAMSRLLERDGHRVFCATNVEEALTQAATNVCDVLISDIGLPDGDGYSLMSQIRHRYGWPGVALSGYGMEADVRKSTAAGFAAHLIKPVEITQLREVITSVMDKEPVSA
ncbi:MAG: multi-sensor hybrid histidine kinase [Prosthecobacter sp.]|nr:multi-sensor hybrid histidine kinase [Prosthecobacter sp.]